MKQVTALCVAMFLTSCSWMHQIGNKGTISGKVVYPGEACPADIKVVAVDVDSEKEYSYDVFREKRNEAVLTKAEYRLRLPEGRYYLYAISNYEPVRGFKAYYTEFMKCGMTVKCQSHERVVLNVKSGQELNGITLGDWYTDAESSHAVN